MNKIIFLAFVVLAGVAQAQLNPRYWEVNAPIEFKLDEIPRCDQDIPCMSLPVKQALSQLLTIVRSTCLGNKKMLNVFLKSSPLDYDNKISQVE